MIFDDEIKFILGHQIFFTAPIAHFLRDKKGYEIERKIETGLNFNQELIFKL